MAITLPLEKMSVGEKLMAMEALWNDLCRTADGISSPSWHEDVLNERASRVEKVGEEFIDWSAAKQYIKDKIS